MRNIILSIQEYDSPKKFLVRVEERQSKNVFSLRLLIKLHYTKHIVFTFIFNFRLKAMHDRSAQSTNGQMD